MNDEKERNESSNFRSITCFPIMRKVSAEVMTEQVYGHMEREKLWPDEQKGYIRQRRGAKNQLIKDKMVMKKEEKNGKFQCCLDRL